MSFSNANQFAEDRLSFTYRFIKGINHFVTRVFFSQVEVSGIQNIPTSGPLIIVGNHKNQFVDAMLVTSSVERNISFIIAEKSMHRPIVGQCARLMNAVPVVRPQDLATPGPGIILRMDPATKTIHGSGTNFLTHFATKGALIKLKGMNGVRIMQAKSDTECTYADALSIDEDFSPDDFNRVCGALGAKYTIIPKVDQSKIFGTVHSHLRSGKSICIFPEGGSSDRTDLLPLKVGVAIMALGALQQGTPVRVVPFGINYFAGHAFRSRVFIDVGEPLVVSPDLVSMYSSGKKREACDELLKQIEQSLRNVTQNAPDYETMKICRTMRRMFQGDIKLPMKKYLELNRRVLNAAVMFRKVEPQLDNLMNEVASYLDLCEANGISDKHIQDLPRVGGVSPVIPTITNVLFAIIMSLIFSPMYLFIFIINSPVLIYISRASRAEMKKALAGSSVKVKGLDVAASYKIMFGTIYLIILWIVYAVIIGVGLGFGLAPNPYPEDTPENTGYMLIPILVPIAFLLLIFPLNYMFLLIFEATLRRFKLFPKYWMILKSVCRGQRSQAAILRRTRKELSIKVQDVFEYAVIPRIPAWAGDPIIDRKLLLDNRRRSDKEIGERLQLQITVAAPGHKEMDIKMDSSAMRKSFRKSTTDLDLVREELRNDSPAIPEDGTNATIAPGKNNDDSSV